MKTSMLHQKVKFIFEVPSILQAQGRILLLSICNIFLGGEINPSSSKSYLSMENQKSGEEDIVTSVDAYEARDLLASGYAYLDVRMKEDFAKGHVDDALNVPFYSSVTPQGKVKNPQFVDQVSSIFGKDAHFIVGCNTGVRSKLATADLLNAGFENIKNMARGYKSWVEATSKE